MSLGIVASSGVASYAAEVLADSPAFYYPLDETSGTTAVDDSGNGRNATMTGGLWVADAGVVGGRAWAQDGTSGQYGEVAYTTDHPSAVTLEAWVKPAATQAAGQPTILAKSEYYASAHTRFPIKLLAKQGTELKFALHVDSGNDFSADVSVVAPTTWVADRWYHVVGVFQNGTSRLYVDGIEVASAATAFNLASSGAGVPWMIGTQKDYDAGSGGSRLNGRIAHVALYPSAQSAARIAARYNALAA